MRIAVVFLVLASTAVCAEPVAQQYDPAQFEQRFKKADTDGDGRLSRQEAYAAFPRMPEFFDEIDAGRDGAITLLEIEQALERRVAATIGSTSGYGTYAGGKADSADRDADVAQQRSPASETEARRLHRQQYYESISGDKAMASSFGEPVSKSPSSPLFDKKY